DIRAGHYQVIISSIEAFTDTSRLLPIIKSPHLAQRHRQAIVLDEAHCIPNWGKSFHPKYAVAGDMRLILPVHTPYVAATATAKLLTRKAIRQVLRFGDDTVSINLGNHRPNLAYSVHRLKQAKASVPEILEYFPDKNQLPGYTLIFVDSRPLGQLLLALLRRHVAPELRYKIQIYHAFRSDHAKDVLANGFEKEGGFEVMICTEAMTMGVDFRKVSLVIQVLAPIDAETLSQRGGRAGWDKAMTAKVVLMAQDSTFMDSRAGQKRLLKSIKQEEVNAPGPPDKKSSKKASKKAIESAAKKLVAPSKAKRSPREYTKAILDFINTTECCVKVLDKEFDNPARLETNTPCLCDNCRHGRGELTLQERLAKKSAKGHRVEDVTQDAPEDAPVDATEEIAGTEDPHSEQEEQEDSETDEQDKVCEPSTSEATPKTKKKSPWQSAPKKKPYAEALLKWRSDKLDSPECQDWNAGEGWILSTKMLNLIARDPRITSVDSPALLRPTWTHAKRWGAEIVDILLQVSASQQQIENKKEQAKRAKRKADNAATARLIEYAQARETECQRLATEAAAMGVDPPHPAKRPRLSANATPEERAAQEEEKVIQKRLYARAYYQKNKKKKSETVKTETEDAVISDTLSVQATPSGTPLNPLPNNLKFSPSKPNKS
ncbi:hypothetical protein FRC06_008368, partial [Ceratobasidium sp. 370]